ncbi:uncharacterized protein LOC106664382 isoform X2 [Cimex lectularius]|uniref:Dynein regulatory complex protein 10 n=1 Tax=Cimex lectularius TaxID=79782 RepID=A0A8I6RI94_CIMLE|nr:uncharacterized protein LOC106664382 isoform X2 [Cimex lectularius]
MSKEEDQRSKKLKDVGTEVLRLLKGEQQAVEKVRVQAEVYKVQKLATQFLDKLTFTMCLPQLIGLSFKMIAMHVTYQELMFIKNTMRNISLKGCSIMGGEDHYGAGRKSHFVTASSASSIEKFYANYPVHKENITNKSIEDLWICADMLYNKPEVQKLCTENMLSQLPDNVKELINCLENVFEVILLMMFKSPKEENDRAETMARKYLTTSQLGNEIFQLTTKIRPRVYNNANELQAGWKRIEGLEMEKNALQSFCKKAMEKLRLEANNKMEWDWKVSERKQEKANAIKEDIENQYASAKQEHIKIEKELREKEQRIQRIVTGVVSNYEKELKKRQKVVDKLSSDFEELMANKEKLKEIFDNQSTRFYTLMKEKSRYEAKVRREKLLELKRNIAARKIQRYFRMYRTFMNAHSKKSKKSKRRAK